MTVPRPASLVQLDALALSSRILGLLDGGRRGVIIGAFARSCYVDLDGQLLAVVAAELLNGPLNLVVPFPGAATLAALPISGVVEVRDRVLTLAGEWSVDAARASLWNPRLPPVSSTADLRSRLAVIQDVLEADAPVEGLARLEGRPPRAADAMAGLAEALRQRDAALAGRAAEALAGLGPGLTPSGDDVLAGTLLALSVLRMPQRRMWGEHILSSVRGRTTRISEAYLEAAAAGEAGEAWHHLVSALERYDNLRAAAQRILAVGETSGADMLAGFLLGTTALLPA